MSFDQLLESLPAEDQTAIRRMSLLLQDIEAQTQAFALKTGLHCKSGCGACCENPRIQTTVAEVMPLALEMWGRGQAEEKLKALRQQTQGVCVFYKPDGKIPGHGRCGIYAYRPGICRFFGFSARQDKYGNPQLVTCKVIKESQTEQCRKTQEAIQEGGLKPPLVSSYSLNVANVDPVWGQELFPINDAIRLAVEKIGYILEKLK